MPYLELFDETLDINSTDNYDLSVQLCPEGLAFCILDTIRNKYILIRLSEPEENKYFNASMISDIIRKDDFLGRKFRKTRVLFPSLKSTLVPNALYDPARINDYYTLNYVKEGNEAVLANALNVPEAHVLFACQESFIEIMNDHFKGIEPTHHIKPLLLHAAGERKRQQGHYVHIHVERDFFNLLIFTHNTLALCNSFMYRNVSDILYYVLNAFTRLELKHEDTVHLSGYTSVNDELSSNLRTYIKNILYPVPSGNFTFSYVFNDLDLHRYLNLLTLVNCG